MKQKLKALKHKRLFLLGLGLLIVLVAVFALASNSSVSGNIADKVMRPILGEQGTLTVEGYYFQAQDTVKRSFPFLFPANESLYVPEQVAGAIDESQNTDKLDLAPISLNTGLPKLNGEGQWSPIPTKQLPATIVMARTFIRPDSQRPYAVVTIVKMNLKKLGVGIVSGTRYPANITKIFGPGAVPTNIQDNGNLVAAFNGGFQERDGHYGMVVGTQTYVPLRPGLATFYMYPDGSVKFGEYKQGEEDLSAAAIRQNGPFLLRSGQILALNEKDRDTWGRTITNSLYTWRSGLGIAKDGSLVFAAGPSLVPDTLAAAMQSAGVVDGMQLDINPPWVRFILFSPQNGAYTSEPLTKNMVNGGHLYLTGYEKDFFYIYKK